MGRHNGMKIWRRIAIRRDGCFAFVVHAHYLIIDSNFCQAPVRIFHFAGGRCHTLNGRARLPRNPERTKGTYGTKGTNGTNGAGGFRQYVARSLAQCSAYGGWSLLPSRLWLRRRRRSVGLPSMTGALTFCRELPGKGAYDEGAITIHDCN